MKNLQNILSNSVIFLFILIFSLLFYFISQRNVAPKEINEQKVPSPKRAVSPKAAVEKSYTVKQGDTLWDIAEKIYGDGYDWVKIAKVNNLEKPDRLQIGTNLKIPERVTPSPDTYPSISQNTSYSQPGTNYFVEPAGDDSNDGLSVSTPLKTIQKAVDLARPGETINLGPGDYLQDAVTRRDGTMEAPITITGPANAVVKGAGRSRVLEINHDYINLIGFTLDGLHGFSENKEGYRDKLIYALGKEPRAGVVGLKVLQMTLKNAGGECLRLRYFAQNNEIAYNTIINCGVYDYKFADGGKNGEGVYIGTAPEQRSDGKNPTKDPDASNDNWIHHNTFDTQGNECVDIKEGSSGNIVEYNSCTGQKDPNSGGMNSRGNENTFRYNKIFANRGAGVRLGGDTSDDGINNHVYNNTIKNNLSGGIKFQRILQGKICGNRMGNNTGGNSVGTYRSRFKPESACK